MAAVEDAGRQALDELRHLLGVLRPTSVPRRRSQPQPGLAELGPLVEQTRAGRARRDAHDRGRVTGLPARVELSAYRIVQESLTNVRQARRPGCPHLRPADQRRAARCWSR